MTSFGTVFTPEMILTRFDGVSWSAPELVPSERISIHPAAHVLHYASTCFEGLKAFRHADGSVKIFRLDTSIARMQQSSKKMSLPDIVIQLYIKNYFAEVQRGLSFPSAPYRYK